MGNIVTYIKEQGNYALLEHPFNEIDNLIFSELSYLDLYGKKFTFFLEKHHPFMDQQPM